MLVGTLLAMASLCRAGGFTIQVLDDQTNRGVPLAKLTTVDQVAYYTDSGGRAFVDDPVLMGRKVFFTIASQGYEYPADGFGFCGKAFDITDSGTATIKIHRINIAERLYRVTGAGIYRDTVLAGLKSPIDQPMLNGNVVGQDTCMAVVYRGKIRWFFGDTSRLRYPLGQFGTSGAVSDFPGLDPSIGINLKYFVDDEGFSRRMVPKYEKGAGWLDGLFVLKDAAGQEHMLARCDNVPGLAPPYGRQLLIYNDQTDAFDLLKQIPLDAPLYPQGQAFLATDRGVDYVYFATPSATVRVPAKFEQIPDFSSYEAFTCLQPGERFNPQAKLDLDVNRKPIWGWKKDTATVDDQQLAALIKAGRLKAEDVWFAPRDVETKKQIDLHEGSIRFNQYRKKWVMIAEQIGGDKSFAGEIWYTEADKPIGPWKWARKIVTHDRYSFYNPVQNDFFDSADGRLIYFQGTYSTTFSGRDDATPRYDYNQIMYRLDLLDARLKLPG
jgi:hypothetical protein